MKSTAIFSITVLIYFVLFPAQLSTQDGYWQFKELVSGNYYGSEIAPDKIEVDENEGLVEFTLGHKNKCSERYQLSYRFSQDMSVLSLPENSNSLPTYSYEVEFKSLDTPCYPGQSYSNPYVNFTHAGASSGVEGAQKKDKTWAYKYHRNWLSNHEWYKETGKGGENRHYARKANRSLHGKVNGYYSVVGPFKSASNDHLKKYPGTTTDFRILIKAQSTSSRSEYFYYDLIFVYELVDEIRPEAQDPCDLKKPDCTCCPGTIPIWNYYSKQAECICPEGQIWDKLKNKCIHSE